MVSSLLPRLHGRHASSPGSFNRRVGSTPRPGSVRKLRRNREAESGPGGGSGEGDQLLDVPWMRRGRFPMRNPSDYELSLVIHLAQKVMGWTVREVSSGRNLATDEETDRRYWILVEGVAFPTWDPLRDWAHAGPLWARVSAFRDINLFCQAGVGWFYQVGNEYGAPASPLPDPYGPLVSPTYAISRAVAEATGWFYFRDGSNGEAVEDSRIQDSRKEVRRMDLSIVGEAGISYDDAPPSARLQIHPPERFEGGN